MRTRSRSFRRSFILILAILFLINTATLGIHYGNRISATRENMNESRRELLLEHRQQFDAVIGVAYHVLTTIGQSVPYREFSFRRQETPYYALRLHQSLQAMSFGSYGMVVGVLVADEPGVITGNTITTRSQFRELYGFDTHQADRLEELARTEGRVAFLLTQVGTRRWLHFLLPQSAFDTPALTFASILLSELVPDDEALGGDRLLVFWREELLVVAGSAELGTAEAPVVDWRGEVVFSELDRTAVWAARSTLPYAAELLFAYESPAATTPSAYRLLLVQILLAAIALLAIDATASFFVTESFYRPLRRVIQRLRREATPPVDDSFHYLEERIEDIQQTNAAMRRILDENNLSPAAVTLKRLMYGRTRAAAVGSSLVMHDLDSLNGNGHLVIVRIQCDLADDSLLLSQASSTALTTEVLDGLRRRFLAYRHCHVVELSYKSYGLLVDEPDLDALTRLLLEVTRQVERRYGVRVFHLVHAGPLVLESINRQFLELLQMSERIKIHTRPVITTREMVPGPYSYPLEIEGELIRLAQDGLHEEASQLLENLLEHNVESPTAEEPTVRRFALAMAGTLARVARGCTALDSRFPSQVDEIVAELGATASAADLARRIRELFSAYRRAFTGERASREAELCVELKAYIHRHFHQDISLMDVADRMGLSYKYVSYVFKEAVGENFTSYLNRFRVERAREMIETTEKTVKEVGRLVGCTNPQRFTRMFKRLVGVSPSRYRQERRSA